MAESNLTQDRADALIRLAKYRISDKPHDFPTAGESASIALRSQDRREEFLLDITRGKIKLEKVTFQTRTYSTVILVRLDLEGPPHRNPDGEVIPCPHIHLYRQGYGDKWAVAIERSQFRDVHDLPTTCQDFMTYCNVVEPPQFEWGLF
ncbi:MAG: hypothetical protein SFX74_12175 [Fimbriimonadaceae bacterium]|nr:hypothetical protein [Fimbriimonadaceae bacterium]